MESIDELLDRVERHGRTDDTMELLNAFFEGYPITKLLRLIESANEAAVKSAAFIASELGEQVRPIFEQVAVLLRYPEPRVRADVLDCVLLCATSRHADILGSAVGLIEDTHPGVRDKAVRFLSKFGLDQLDAAAKGTTDNPERKAGIKWLAGIVENNVSPQEVRESLESQDALQRRFAVAAALRLFPTNPELLVAASRHPDSEISEIAELELDIRGLRTRNT